MAAPAFLICCEPTLLVGLAMTTHRFLRIEPHGKESRVIREIAKDLMNQHSGQSYSRAKWIKRREVRFSWFDTLNATDGTGERVAFRSNPIHIKTLESCLLGGEFDPKVFALSETSWPWMDFEVPISAPFHVVASDGAAPVIAVKSPLARAFPILPRMDREGFIVSTFQRSLPARIKKLRHRLVETSGEFWEADWVEDLRAMVSACVSWVDCTLHQLYYKAKYEPLDGWSFDADKLGSPHGMRMSDKLRWVHAITGRHVDGLDDSAAFDRIRRLRNHMHHFDPPCFAFTMEDAAGWLNDAIGVARLVRKIRAAASVGLSKPIVDLLIDGMAHFVPEHRDHKRVPQPVGVGYASSTWEGNVPGAAS